VATATLPLHPPVTPAIPARALLPGLLPLVWTPIPWGTQMSETLSTISTLDNKSENQHCNP
jgi:hypothetical protein